MNLKSVRNNTLYVCIIFIAFALIALCTYIVVDKTMRSRLETEIVIVADLTQKAINAYSDNLGSGISEDLFRLEIFAKNTSDIKKIEDFAKSISYKKFNSNNYDTSYIYGVLYGQTFSVNFDFIVKDPEQQIWFQNAKQTAGQIAFNHPYIERNLMGREVISYSKEFFDNNGKSIGVVNFAIPSKFVIDYVGQFTKFKGGNTFLVDKNYKILTHRIDSLIGKHILQIDPSWIRFVNDKNDDSQIDIKNFLKENSFVVKRKSINNWNLYIVLPLVEYYSDLHSAIIIVVLLNFIFASVLSVILVRLNNKSNLKEEESKAKSNFLATMSHEIRTPLNAIIGLGQIELERNDLSEKSRDNLEKIFVSSNSLLSLINDVLDLSKIESGKFEIIPEDYDIPSLVNDIAIMAQARIGSKPLNFKISVSPEIPSRLNGDYLRIKQVLNNFVSNAVKYTKEGEVEFRAMYESKSLRFDIRDTGIGIKKEDLPKLFGEYNRLDTAKNKTIEGTGLGLSISKKLTKLMGGHIEVQSEYKVGSTFSVSFPQKIIKETPIGSEVAENLQTFKHSAEKFAKNQTIIKTKFTNMSLLVVDDVRLNLDVAEGLLTPYDLNIELATSGERAIDLIKSGKKYDLIFMDHMMPVMDGIEATRIIRSLEVGNAKTVPIIAFTANAMVGNDKMFVEKGFTDFISKPIDIRKLDAILNKYLKPLLATTAISEEVPKISSHKTKSSSYPAIVPEYLHNLNMQKGIEYFGSELAYKKMITSFKTHAPALLADMKTKEGLEYITAVHGLKGICRTIFAEEFGERAFELEMAGKNDKWETVKEKNSDLIKDLEKFIEEL
ncbi:hypothetical protein AGMMS49938_02260 [Fibrobacterales bacterium]|nr:hypothetical protein AGMMS49938_02260 [Fibrobacterales bacterium]